VYTYEQLNTILIRLFGRMGCGEKDSATLSDVLLRAELRGISSHGLLRLSDYYRLWESGRINAKPSMKVIRDTLCTATVDADRAFGMVAGKYSMEIAIEKAKKTGTGWVSTQNSNHFGIAGYYSMMALEHDMIGITTTNANPLVAAPLSTSRLLGTNAIAVAVPAGSEEPFIADFATTPVARGKLAIHEREQKKVPYGFLQDSEGNPSNDPGILAKGGAILPLGGDLLHGSHKGFCLSSVVDILSGVLSGANFGPFVPPNIPYLEMPERQPGKGIGHFFGALRVDAFQPLDEFKGRMDEWVRTIRSATPVNQDEPIIVPGDIERQREAAAMKEGIRLMDSVEKDLAHIAEKLGIDIA
jgi:LDH2 family malate/lactate/ureidoglycolate dehydrogenase